MVALILAVMTPANSVHLWMLFGGGRRDLLNGNLIEDC